ncbi:alkaline phosphatase family protein [Fusibacter paucivorans]|uniref:Alkaline phosphatase family protein n=1 Tax=Fusibacter paucivorans TaxID=76009 RepID=A0ABS5PP06_9FIRM|nr:alkaline phosphatase family protein [Fusibacter paucivorans]MBS7526899.1 alkaline phosphatase family protein [Fusibacter paucivorans]
MMKRNQILVIVFLVLIGMLSGCQVLHSEKPIGMAPEGLQVLGDVAQFGDVTVYWDTLTKETVVFDENDYTAIPAEMLIAAFQPLEGTREVALIADDGFMVKLPYDTLTDTYIGYREELGWCYLTEKHPVNARIKHIREIIVIGDDADAVGKSGLNIVTKEANVHLSLGELLAGSYCSIAFLDGSSNLDGLEIDVMKRKKCIRLSDLLTDAGSTLDVSNLLIMDREGEHYYESVSDGYFEVENQKINYISTDLHTVIRDIYGAVINPPAVSNRDNFDDSIHYLEKGQKVVTLFLDGFSYTQYEAIKATHPDWFLSQLEAVQMATTVYKPVTNAGFAAMITGEVPAVNGVFDRSYRMINCGTIFDRTASMGRSSALIEGDIKILDIQTKTYLNTDDNGDGYTDDEVFERAKALIESGEQPDYLLVHFHGIDDAGHDYGRFHEKTLQRIEAVNGYVKELRALMSAETKVVITADHGMHDTADGGDHGDFRYEDLIVPYAID